MKQESFSNKSSKKQEGFHFGQVEDLYGPVEKIIKSLYPNIKNGEYGLIIGDDASGRIPALLLNEVIKNLYKEFGYEKPDIRFLSGSRNLSGEEKEQKKELISEYLEKVRKNLSNDNSPKKTLVVTDVVATGVSLDPLIETLKEMNMDFDIVSVGDATTDDVEKRWGKEVYFGKTNMPAIYGEDNLHGVVKNVNELFSHPIKNNLTYYTEKEKVDIQLNINEAREDMQNLAEKILEDIRKKNK